MGKINISLEDDLEQRFRKAVYESKGVKKGELSEAISEALEDWIKKQKSVKK